MLCVTSDRHYPWTVAPAGGHGRLVQPPSPQASPLRASVGLPVSDRKHRLCWRPARGAMPLSDHRCRQPGHDLATPVGGLAVGGQPCRQPTHRWSPLARRQHYLHCQSLQQTRRTVLRD
ncbi:hypothetical protein GW17_00003519 [Ensete ventricosum]|nr:hypothetical protein GW17_00003519 [Ensete ventricosum]RZS10602.1 hypothetical protein BHM03_00041845 [Ensete ventricosum]